jgi:tRNA (guanine6-N2)-methyltransferase
MMGAFRYNACDEHESTPMSHYFARVTAGLEQVAWREIALLPAARLRGFGHRRIDFAYASNATALLQLRSIDDVYLRVGHLDGLDHTRASLSVLSGKLAQLDFVAAADAIASLRPLPIPQRYRVTASYLGRRNYNRYDIEGAVADGLDRLVPWRFVPNSADAPDAFDLDVRVLLEDDWALVGIRLGHEPLHRRPYKVATQPGSLKPPVAFCLCMLAELRPADILLDLACGVGTIVIEAATLLPQGLAIGGDVDATAVAGAARNMDAAGLPYARIAADTLWQQVQARPADLRALLYHGDARALKGPADGVQAIVSNLPWGQQVNASADIAPLYRQIVRRIDYLLAATGRTVLLTTHTQVLEQALAQHPQLVAQPGLTLSLFGAHPTAYLLHRP